MFKGTPYINRVVQKKEEERSLHFHRNNLRKMKPLTGLPETYQPVQINNGKKQYQNEVKFTEIERENRILLQKITSIMNKTKKMNTTDPWASNRHNKSLNSTYRKKQLEEIQIQNAKLLKRLQQKKPNYDTERLNVEWRKQKNVKKLMSHYPTSLDKRSARHSLNAINQKNRTNPKIEPIESYRIKVINGINFLITIKLTSKSLVITGDTKESKGIKVIEIERNEAIQFIEDQCQGKVELLFDRLRYDKEEEALYLVSNEVTLDDVVNKEKDQNKQKVVEEDQEQNLEQRGEDPEKASNNFQSLTKQKEATIRSEKNDEKKETIKSEKKNQEILKEQAKKEEQQKAEEIEEEKVQQKAEENHKQEEPLQEKIEDINNEQKNEEKIEEKAIHEEEIAEKQEIKEEKEPKEQLKEKEQEDKQNEIEQEQSPNKQQGQEQPKEENP